MFEDSFNATLDRYRKLLTEVNSGHLQLMNDNFDTGEATGPGQYQMNDDAYANEAGREVAVQPSKAAAGRFINEIVELIGRLYPPE